jgi:hypothetical protein
MNRNWGRKIWDRKMGGKIFLPIIFLPVPFPGFRGRNRGRWQAVDPTHEPRSGLGAWAGSKAVLKPPQSKRWRDPVRSPCGAERLDCGGFSAAVPRSGFRGRNRGCWRTVGSLPETGCAPGESGGVARRPGCSGEPPAHRALSSSCGCACATGTSHRARRRGQPRRCRRHCPSWRAQFCIREFPDSGRTVPGPSSRHRQ